MTRVTMELLPDEVRRKIAVHYGHITDGIFLSNLLGKERPDKIYHLAAQSFVGYSFQNVLSTYDANIGGTLNVCNAAKDYSPDTMMYFAAKSEMFGQTSESPQNENTPFLPRSPYAVSKLAGSWTVRTYRDAYKLLMTNGILFNYESEVRGPEFVTRKISLGLARIIKGSRESIILGNLDARKDWGYATDFLRGMWMMMQKDYPDDFVLGTGEQNTVREFAEEAFMVSGINITWKGSGINEIGVSDEGKTMIKVRKEFYRPLESDNYKADYTKAKEKLEWNPEIKFRELVRIMVESVLKKFMKINK